MGCRNNLSTLGFNKIADFIDKQMNSSRIETIFDLFNNDYGWRFWVAQNRQKGENSEGPGGK